MLEKSPLDSNRWIQILPECHSGNAPRRRSRFVLVVFEPQKAHPSKVSCVTASIVNVPTELVPGLLIPRNSKGVIWKSESGNEGNFKNFEQKDIASIGAGLMLSILRGINCLNKGVSWSGSWRCFNWIVGDLCPSARIINRPIGYGKDYDPPLEYLRRHTYIVSKHSDLGYSAQSNPPDFPIRHLQFPASQVHLLKFVFWAIAKSPGI